MDTWVMTTEYQLRLVKAVIGAEHWDVDHRREKVEQILATPVGSSIPVPNNEEWMKAAAKSNLSDDALFEKLWPVWSLADYFGI